MKQSDTDRHVFPRNPLKRIHPTQESPKSERSILRFFFRHFYHSLAKGPLISLGNFWKNQQLHLTSPRRTRDRVNYLEIGFGNWLKAALRGSQGL